MNRSASKPIKKPHHGVSLKHKSTLCKPKKLKLPIRQKRRIATKNNKSNCFAPPSSFIVSLHHQPSIINITTPLKQKIRLCPAQSSNSQSTPNLNTIIRQPFINQPFSSLTNHSHHLPLHAIPNPISTLPSSRLSLHSPQQYQNRLQPLLNVPLFTTKRSILTATNSMVKFLSGSNSSYSNTSSTTRLINCITTLAHLLPKRSHVAINLTQTAQMATKHEEVGVSPPTEQQDTIFGKMTRDEIPVPKVYEDDKCIVINDLNPQAKVHMLLIPRQPISQLSKAEDDDEALLGHLFTIARKVAKQRGIDETGYRLVVNNGKDGCQSVYHLHIHILGGEALTGSFA